MSNLLLGQHLPHIGSARRVTHHGRSAAKNGNGPVAGLLHIGHNNKLQQMANMETVCGGIKAYIKSNAFTSKKLSDFILMGGLSNKASLFQSIKDICTHGLFLQ